MKLIVGSAEYREVSALLAAAVEYDTTGGSESVADLAAGAQLYKVSTEQGAIVAAYALRLTRNQLRNVAWITAAGGKIPRVDLIRSVLPLIEAQARQMGARQIAFATKRPGMIDKMQKRGYTATAVELRKNLA